MFTFETTGDFSRTEKALTKMLNGDIFSSLAAQGAIGVAALSAATPVDSGRTASSWNYTVEKSSGSYSIIWTNSSMAGGTPVVIMLQYGHGTGTGGYVQGRDFINPAIKPVFDKIAADVWKAVTSA